MNQSLPLALFLATTLFAVSAPARAAADASPPRRPNVVLVLADDMGYSDLGCMGGEIRTPNLDKLAAGGLRFTQFYNGARCCPTRASLLTGLYPHQAGVGRMTTADTGLPGYRGHLVDSAVTIPEVLGGAGYRTGMVGKWHLSLTEEKPGHMRRLANQEIAGTFSDPKSYPVGRGFASHYGIIWGVADYFDPFSLVRNATPVREVPAGYYITDALTDEAVKFIGGREERAVPAERKAPAGQQALTGQSASANRPAQPFFLYLAYTAPHWPLHAREEDVARYAETYKVGWDAIREARHKRMVEKGLLPAGGDTLSPPIKRKTPWADNPDAAWDARAMAVHAAMVDRLDQGVGRVVAELDRLKLLDDTLILFLSDNGASPEAYPSPGFDRPRETRDGRKITYPPNKTVMPGTETTFFGMGPAWANVASTPLRGWKADTYEGGICTPMIAHWPKGVTTPPGTVTTQPGHVMDLMATCLELSAATYPAEFGGHAITPLAGKSLLPILRGGRREGAEGHEVIGWEHFGARAIRQGDWKLVGKKDAPWELYDLSADRCELNDRAAVDPGRVKAMAARWEQWAEATNVLPMPEQRAAKPAGPR
jgi:arylsulfatase A-like enzyme